MSNNRPTGSARQKTACRTQRITNRNSFPAQFYAVLWKQATLIGPFTTLGTAEQWAADHGGEQSCAALNVYAPLLHEPDHGHEIGQVIP